MSSFQWKCQIWVPQNPKTSDPMYVVFVYGPRSGRPFLKCSKNIWSELKCERFFEQLQESTPVLAKYLNIFFKICNVLSLKFWLCAPSGGIISKLRNEVHGKNFQCPFRLTMNRNRLRGWGCWAFYRKEMIFNPESF